MRNYEETGFTLVELVLIIVILGVLAATALPKFINLGVNARIATVNHLRGAVRAASELAHAECIAKTACKDDATAQSNLMTSPTGLSGYLFHGYPTGKTRTNSYFGIKEWLNIGDNMTLQEDLCCNTEILVSNAPDPTNCKVRYTESYGNGPTITAYTSGC